MASVQFRTEAYNPFWPRFPNTRGLKPLLASAFPQPKPISANVNGIFEISGNPFWPRFPNTRGLKPLLAPVFFEPRPITVFGFGFYVNRGIKVACNCKIATAPLYASVPRQPRPIRRGKNAILH